MGMILEWNTLFWFSLNFSLLNSVFWTPHYLTTSLFEAPHHSGHLTNQDTSLFETIRTPHYSGHVSLVLKATLLGDPFLQTFFLLVTFR